LVKFHYCETLLIKISLTKHLNEMHQHLNKRLIADCVPQVDFTYTEDYEWATFVKGSLTPCSYLTYWRTSSPRSLRVS
jgi:hypothetical protein